MRANLEVHVTRHRDRVASMIYLLSSAMQIVRIPPGQALVGRPFLTILDVAD